MGARVAKLINDNNDSEAEKWDPEIGDGLSSTESSWDSDLSSVSNEDNAYHEYRRPTEQFASEGDRYVVEKRFIAGSSSYQFDIIKKKA
uniref:Uncharacterized protein n=1 Tax=Caenorhabditis japonica TaxID=281687 RepID=A0A8R1IZP4_CAEJA